MLTNIYEKFHIVRNALMTKHISSLFIVFSLFYICYVSIVMFVQNKYSPKTIYIFRARFL